MRCDRPGTGGRYCAERSRLPGSWCAGHPVDAGLRTGPGAGGATPVDRAVADAELLALLGADEAVLRRSEVCGALGRTDRGHWLSPRGRTTRGESARRLAGRTLGTAPTGAGIRSPARIPFRRRFLASTAR